MTEYRIDDLARAAGTTTRNIRGYQDRGLLPRPTKRGRIAIYSDVHLSRLALINNLFKRGFTARHIADFITGMQRGDNLAQVLGVDEILAERWSTAESEVVPAETLQSMLGTADPEIHATMIRIGLIERAEADGAWTLLDRDTVHNIADLIDLGLSLTSMLDVFARMDSNMNAAATTLISAAREEFETRRGQGWVPRGDDESEWAATLMTQMRQTATKAAHNALNRALDRSLSVELDDYLGR